MVQTTLSCQGSISASGTFQELQGSGAFAKIEGKSTGLRAGRATQTQLRLDMTKYSMESGLEETDFGECVLKVRLIIITQVHGQ